MISLKFLLNDMNNGASAIKNTYICECLQWSKDM